MNSRQRCSFNAPRQPRKPVTMVMPPATSSRLAADKDGKDKGREENSAWVKDSQTPTPNRPHPPSCLGRVTSHQCQKVTSNVYNMIHHQGWFIHILTQKMRLKTNIKYLTQHKHLWDTDILWKKKKKRNGEYGCNYNQRLCCVTNKMIHRIIQISAGLM